MTAKIDGASGTAPAYDIETGETPAPAAGATAPVPDPSTDALDISGAAVKQLEREMEANFVRDQLQHAQHAPDVRVLYDKTQNDPGAKASETNAAVSVSAGLKLGTNKDNQSVQVKRAIGSAQGYEDERQAIAVARMAGVEPAAVVRVNDRWYAVECNANPAFTDGKGTTLQHTEGSVTVQGLPPYSEVEKLRGEIAANKKTLQAEKDIQRYKDVLAKPLSEAEEKKNREYLKNPKLGETDKARLRDALPENRAQVEARLKQLEKEYPTRLSEADKKQISDTIAAERQKMAPLLFGLPDSEIQFNSSTSKDSADKQINIDPMNPSSTGDILGREHYEHDKEFEPGLRPTFGIKLEELDDPRGAAGVLFHEVTHLKDDELAQKMVKLYQDGGHTFVKTREGGMAAFQKWVNERVGKTPPTPPLSKADAETVVDKAYNFTARSEARAYGGAALAALEAGNVDEAINQLKTYAGALKDGRAASPPDASAVEADVTKQFQELYRKHPELRSKIQDAINAAKQENKDAWIGKIKLAK